MANKIKLKRGLSTNINSLELEAGELAITTDTSELYAGDKNNNAVKINNNTTYALSKNGSSIILTGSDGSTTSVADSNTTYNAATTSANGLMSSSDKTKLNGIATGATKNTASSTTPKANGTAAVGSEANYARGDHVHPAQTTVSGNAGTATKFASAQSVALTGDVTGSASSQAGWSVATTLANSGVTAGSYGPTANVTGTDGTTINVPQITVDAKGRVTSVTNRVYTSKNTDTNTTYSNMTAATSSAAGKAGLVPAPAAGKQSSFLRGDGTWVVPTNTTYSAATTSANGLMSSSDKTKLNGIATGAQVNNVVVSTSQPTASTAEVWINPNGQTSLDVLSVFGEYAECMIDTHTTMSQSTYWSDPKVPFSSLKSTSNSTMFTYSSNGIKCNFTGRVLIFANYTCDTTGKEMDPQVSLSDGSPEMRSMINVGSGSASFSFIADVNNGCIITMGVNCNVDSWKVYSSTALRVLRLK